MGHTLTKHAFAAAAVIAAAFGSIQTACVATADDMGKPDIDGYCRSIHGGNDLETAGPLDFNQNSWHCVPTGEQVDITAACKWQFGPTAQAVNNAHNVYEWHCNSGGAPLPMGNSTTIYSGTWSSGPISRPASLNLSSLDPISGVIDIPGLCTANWTEVQKLPNNNRLINADVTSGPCTNNRWLVRVAGNSINGEDAAGRPGNVSFTHNS
jgi:hypothetical protein